MLWSVRDIWIIFPTWLNKKARKRLVKTVKEDERLAREGKLLLVEKETKHRKIIRTFDLSSTYSIHI
jgi:hypothetical protein